MRIGRTKYQMKSPWRLGLFAAVLIGLGYFAITSCGGSNDVSALYETPGSIPCYAQCDTTEPVAYSFPFTSDAERDAFVEEAVPVNRASDLSSSYLDALGAPIVINMYIPSTSNRQSPEYFVADGAVYLPAVPLPGDEPGLFQQIVSADGQEQEAVTLGFAPDQVPSASFVRVYGFVYWTSDFMNPNFDAEAATVQPVVVVGSWEELSSSQLLAPAVRTWPEPDSGAPPLVVVRRGNLRIAVNKVEFAAAETRVHVNVRNLSPTQNATYDPSNATLITGDGQVLGVMDQEVRDDSLDSVNLPAGAAADKRLSRSGYLVFPSVPATDAMIVSLPDLNGTEDSMRIEVPTAAAVSG